MLHTNIVEFEKTNITDNKFHNIKNKSENLILNNNSLQENPNTKNKKDNIKKPEYQEILWLTGC
tara:strand:- start:33 stop:224 length:192 start_codon:yes stop_codon:yes gene_type:complete